MIGKNKHSATMHKQFFLLLSAKLCVVTIFARLVSLSNHKNMRQRH